MSCRSCHSRKVCEYTSEINIHFLGAKGLTIPTVWIFPTLLVGPDCGMARFAISDVERKTLADRDYRERADGASSWIA